MTTEQSSGEVKSLRPVGIAFALFAIVAIPAGYLAWVSSGVAIPHEHPAILASRVLLAVGVGLFLGSNVARLSLRYNPNYVE